MASSERGPGDLGVDRKEQGRHLVSLHVQVCPAGPGQGRLSVTRHVATLKEPAPRPGHGSLNHPQQWVALACPDVFQEEKPRLVPSPIAVMTTKGCTRMDTAARDFACLSSRA